MGNLIVYPFPCSSMTLNNIEKIWNQVIKYQDKGWGSERNLRHVLKSFRALLNRRQLQDSWTIRWTEMRVNNSSNNRLEPEFISITSLPFRNPDDLTTSCLDIFVVTAVHVNEIVSVLSSIKYWQLLRGTKLVVIQYIALQCVWLRPNYVDRRLSSTRCLNHSLDYAIHYDTAKFFVLT